MNRKTHDLARHYKSPDLSKVYKNIGMTADQWNVFKKACQLSKLTYGDFVIKASQEFITLYELRGMENNFKKVSKKA